MRAKDVMTADVVTVAPEAPVTEIAKAMLERRISAVPVVDSDNRPVGIVSEGDLMRRPESETLPTRSWWLRLFDLPDDAAATYVKSHGLRARDVMSRSVVTVTEDTDLGEVARLLEEHRIKRVPVVKDGGIVGLVSRADLLRGLASAGGPAPSAGKDDEALRTKIMTEVWRHDWARRINASIVVTAGVAHLWGIVHSDTERDALRVAAENTPGVKGTEDHLTVIPHWWEIEGEKDYD